MKVLITKQSGFTLIELMITIVLGLLVITAALALFLGGSRNLRVQEAAGSVQDAQVFSLSYIQKEIAMANLGAFVGSTQDSPWTGIVLTGSLDHPSEMIEGTTDPRQIGNLRGLKLASGDITNDLLSTNEVGDTPTTLNSNVSRVASGSRVNSDQITIQYEAPFFMQDCEGNNVSPGEIVVERFFARQDTTTAGMIPPYSIAIACDGGKYGPLDSGSVEVTAGQVDKDMFVLQNFGDNGEILVNRVDVFKIKLGVMLENGIKYMSISDYMTLDNANKSGYKFEGPIVSIKMGVIARGVNPIGTQTPTQFSVLGDDYKITNDTKKYVRRVYESTIYLRNGAV